MQNPKRQLSAYEKNHLLTFGFDLKPVDQYEQMPVEYITAKCIFASLIFDLDRHVLIPRVETEELLELASNFVQKFTAKHQRAAKILELGTGSGCLGISLADFLSKLEIDYQLTLTDISPLALKAAIRNWAKLMPNQEVNFIESDLLDSVFPQKFDLILANLPYIPHSRMSQLDKSVKNYEPHLALDGGKDGLELISRLLSQAPAFLSNEGVIFLEIDETQNLKQFSENYRIKLIQDQFKKNRFACLKPIL